MSDDDNVSYSTSISFNRFTCLICPGRVPIEAKMLKTAYLPDQTIQVSIKFNELLSQVKQLTISLYLDFELKNFLTSKAVK